MSDAASVLHLDISGFGVRITGPEETLQPFREEWSQWIGPGAGETVLAMEFQVAGEPPEDQATLRKVFRADHGEKTSTLTTGEGHVDLHPGGRAVGVVRTGGPRFRFYGLQNLLLAALARVLPNHGVVLVHGAGIVIDGTAVVLIGPEGAGKTTWSRIAVETGAGLLSDDLLMVGLDRGRPTVFRSPFRGGGAGPGRVPLGMLLSSRHAEEAALLPFGRLAMAALVSANLPYAGDRVGGDDAVTGVVDALLDKVSFRVLAFAKSPAFMPVLRSGLKDESGE